MDLSSIGEALEWSPKNTPKKAKKKTFVRLSSYENQCFSNIAAGGMQDSSPASFTKSNRNLLNSCGKTTRVGGMPPMTPVKIQKLEKSVSGKVPRSAKMLVKQKSVGDFSDKRTDDNLSLRRSNTSRNKLVDSCQK